MEDRFSTSVVMAVLLIVVVIVCLTMKDCYNAQQETLRACLDKGFSLLECRARSS